LARDSTTAGGGGLVVGPDAFAVVIDVSSTDLGAAVWPSEPHEISVTAAAKAHVARVPRIHMKSSSDLCNT